MHEAPKNRAPEILAYLAVAVVMFGAGMLLESHLAARTAGSVKLAHEHELKQAQEKAEEQRRMLTDTMAKEREDHANAIQAKDRNLASKDKNLASLASRAAGVRNALETDLSAARSSGEACTARIAGISEAVDGVFDSVGEVAGIAQNLGRENQQLKEDNKSLAEKLAGWQKWNTERTQRVTVLGEKKG
jgi:chromosome segregation ATPase